MAKKFKPHPEANNAYIPMYQDYVNSLEVHHLEYDKVNNDFRHPYFINYKKQKMETKPKKPLTWWLLLLGNIVQAIVSVLTQN